MSTENGTTTDTTKDDLLIISDSTKKLMEVTKMLEVVARDKDRSAQARYYARDAAKSLRLLIAGEVMG